MKKSEFVKAHKEAKKKRMARERSDLKSIAEAMTMAKNKKATKKD